ncbi:threonine synthase [Halomarina rubra]|uniref:Threonine synthase n=1 Tax=Halomarina rubra TaxID=2071873 RepID=A0ABD6AV05_9EURY|nr:threonine synthase [Halomarina rubra]
MLRCPACESEYEDRWRCSCGHALEFADPPRPDPDAPDAREGLWAFEAFLPVDHRVSLGEGYTPLVDAPDWDAQFKLEYVFPSGSFKDRGATTTLSRALDVGAERVVEDSSGNAGAAIATYAARAGVDCEIYVPASVKASKLRAIERAGADVVRVEGSRQAVTDACVEAVEEGAGWYASHAWNPAFFAGTATVAYELAHQRDWSVPDAIVLPLGHGTLFLGAYRGFRALQEAGWTDSMPRLLGVQAAGYDPIAREFESKRRGSGRDGVASGETPDPDAAVETNDLADGIQIRDPARGDQIRAAIEATDGDCIGVDAAATERELDALHARGFYTEPTCAVAPAGLREYRERGVLDEGSDVVVPLTGSGLKG